MDALIFGYKGQVGEALTRKLGDSTGIERSGCDLTRDDQVEAVVSSYSPDIVFNGVGVNDIDLAEREYENALSINGLVPGRLSSHARKVGAVFVHFSSGYVFGDGHSDPIDETAVPRPLSGFGRSKLLGERFALQNNPRTFVLRSSALYSHRRRNFVRDIIAEAVTGERVTAVGDCFVSPTWVDPLAETAIALSRSSTYGTYHACAAGSCSWYQFAGRIFEILDIPCDLHPVDAQDADVPARRPPYSSLDSGVLRAAGLADFARWDDMLERFLAEHGEALVSEAS